MQHKDMWYMQIRLKNRRENEIIKKSDMYSAIFYISVDNINILDILQF